VGSLIIDEIFQKFGVETSCINNEPDGHFPNRPSEPAPKNLGELIDLAKNEKFNFSVAYDGDADRCVFIDDVGLPVTPEKIGIIVAKSLITPESNKVLAGVPCSMILEEEIPKIGGELIWIRVGDVFVCEELKKHDAVLALEISAHFFAPGLTDFIFDAPIIFSLKLAEYLHKTGSNLSQLSRDIPSYPYEHSVSWPGKGRGMARTPRKSGGSGRGAEAPNTVGGRRAHPPKVEKEWDQKINAKERKKAFRSALAATSQESYVNARGHTIPDKATLPYVVDNKIESIAGDLEGESLTKRAMSLFDGLGIGEDVDRAASRKGIRAGKGKRRGRKYRNPRSVLVVLSENNGSERAFRNLSGVDVTTAKDLNTELLAPGGDPGRLVVFSKAAVSALGERL
jgi:large subunit ribosomal protein L4e